MTGLPTMPVTKNLTNLTLATATCLFLAITPGPAFAEKGDRLVPANPLGPNWRTNVDKERQKGDKTKPNSIEDLLSPGVQQPAPAAAEPKPIQQPAPQQPAAAPTQPAPLPTAKPAAPVEQKQPAPAPVKQATKPAPTPADDKSATIKKLNKFFNTITYLEGRFEQTDASNNKTKGNFYVKRPGRIRFDYDSPSNVRIVSDGKWLSIEDRDLNTVDRYPLDTTPFKLLLKRNVNIENDAHVLEYFKGDNLISITMVDKKEDNAGKIRLFFQHPEIQLKEWIITDPQGLDTRIELQNVVVGKRIKPGFFVVSDDSMSVFDR